MSEKTGQSPDKNLLITILVLITFGWILSFSASLGYSDSYSYVIKQGSFIVLGLGAGFFVLKTPVSFFKKYSPLLFIVTLVLLILVFIPGITAGKINGAYRWIDVFGFFNFQPSEMMKLTMILFMAGFLIRQEKEVTSSLKGLGKTMFIVALSGTLTMFETDLGATIIITITALSMLFIAGTYIKELLITGGALFGAAGIFIWFNPNRSARLFDFWEIDLWSNHSDKVYQTKQALIGIARGDWTGTGLGAGIQKYTKLPESHTDMIFAIIGEELGIIGMLFVLFCFAYIIGKGFDIAKEALKHGRKYSSYVAFGICTWFSMQTGVNIAMNLGLIPIKGFTLPLISYGGSSMIFSMVALAFLLRIDMENRAGYTKKKNYV
jgi:cell division protein FtsW